MDELSRIEALPRNVALAMLDFVLQSQQSWSWVTKDLCSPKDFLPGIVRFVTTTTVRGSDDTELAEHNLIAARVTDIATTHLHHAKASRDLNAIKTYIPLVNWLSSNAVEVSSYNSSLQANLRRNFSAKFAGLGVSDIQRTGLTEREYGPNFFFDVEHANRLLAHQVSWHGIRGRTQDQSFSAEFRRANTNLALVDSEVTLLGSLQRLCIDHCTFFAQDREIQRSMARITQRCFQANAQTYPAETIFESLFQTRAELSLALLRELVASGARGSEFLELLEPAWTAVRFRSGSYEQAITSDDLAYWRLALSNLFMALQFHVNKKTKSALGQTDSTALAALDPEISTYLEITSQVVADGFRSILVGLQDQQEKKSSVNAEEALDVVGLRDISLLLTLLQAILRLPSLPQFAAELSGRLSSSGIIDSCLILYSWSHFLSRQGNGDQHQHASLCIQILASISSLPLVAEELAVEGVLNRILSAKMTQLLQAVPGGASHVDSRPTCTSLYRLWAAGFLPLCLNLLQGVGGAVAPEVSNFLNQFPEQLARAGTSFVTSPEILGAGAHVLTLTLASEAATLALLSHGLASYREAGASAAVDPTTISPLNGYDEHRKPMENDVRKILESSLEGRQKITVPTSEKELKWQTAKNGDQLDSKIVTELKMAATALHGDDNDDVDDDKK
jgi:nuclear pore complex protein Nup188